MSPTVGISNACQRFSLYPIAVRVPSSRRWK